jgi:hypothetical protein
MTFKEFVETYDQENAIVLLEGKRTVAEADQTKLVALGKLLAASTSRMKFRSGNAAGADQYFSAGVTQVDPKRLQVITPYTDHRKRTNLAWETYALDQINLAAEPEVVYQSKHNKSTQKLIDRFVAGDKDRFALKAAYIIRDTVKVIGTESIPRATFGVFYDDLTNPMTGGTGHTMQTCINNQIPLVDQTVWMEWVK